MYRLHRETFHLAAEFVDRYLSTERKIAKQRLQLIGVTSLFIAAKIEVEKCQLCFCVGCLAVSSLASMSWGSDNTGGFPSF